MIDVNTTSELLIDVLLPEQEKAFGDWKHYGELGSEANYELMKRALSAIWGSFLDPAQSVGEALAGDTMDNIDTLMRSLIKVIDAKETIYKTITIECE